MPLVTTDSLTPAALDEPLYYLHNLRTVVRWVSDHHRDLLTDAECAQLVALLALAEPSQALLARMTMRKGALFRSDTLNYREIPDIHGALNDLVAGGFIDSAPALPAEALHALCRREDIVTLLLAQGVAVPKSARKSDLLSTLHALSAESQPLSDWWPDAPFSIVALSCMPLLDRVRLLFFGNLHQDWSEFVLTELGHQRYESVPFNGDSRAFRSRAEVDTYLAIHHCHETLTALVKAPERLPLLTEQLPPPDDNPWLEHRRRKLLFAVAHSAERLGQHDLAQTLYQQNPHEEARVRLYRMQEKHASPEKLLPLLNKELSGQLRPETRLLLTRVQHRLQKKLGQKVARAARSPLPTRQMLLPKQEQRVEFATLDALTHDSCLNGYYTENWLFTGLLGLLLWPVIFAPLPGAFFHPFQSGPADLYRPDFVSRRQQKIDERLSSLHRGEYRDLIRQCWHDKFGISCALVHWPALPEALVEQALAIIPAEHLQVIFRHLLADLRHHRRGMPDLTLFDADQRRYQLVEVKGPGDRLQDHQTLWLETMHRHGIPVEVATVTWSPSP